MEILKEKIRILIKFHLERGNLAVAKQWQKTLKGLNKWPRVFYWLNKAQYHGQSGLDRARIEVDKAWKARQLSLENKRIDLVHKVSK